MGVGKETAMATPAQDTRVLFSSEKSISKLDTSECPISIIGKLSNLKKIQYADVANNCIDEKLWNSAVNEIASGSRESVSLYLNKFQLAALPSKCSRHNAPSRPQALTKLVKSLSSNHTGKEACIIVCERKDVFASGCAVARTFSTYTRKTIAGPEDPIASKNIPRLTKHEVHVEFIIVDESNGGLSENDVATLNQSALGIQLSARIVDAPCNEMHTDGFIEEAKKVGQELGITPLVIQGEDLANQGFGGIYGVGKAAVHAPALVVLSHTPAGAKETVAWVGKGIVYDTGGLSIKGKTAMPGMKRDCGGAAGILGAFYLAVKQGFSQNLHAVFCLAENAVGDRATRPDDIHTLYSGKTVEINNTDAEGRLVVSDGVCYADRDLNASVIVDMCTLTGAQGISTGQIHAAHLTNDETMEEFCRHAGKISGELSFPLVYAPEFHFQEFKSAVADMKNSVADRNNAQSSCAGLFINAHLGFEYPGTWLHIDMAAPAYTGERATGYGVALLNTLFGKYSQSTLLSQAYEICTKNMK